MKQQFFIWLLAIAFVTAISPIQAQQPKKLPLIGYIGNSSNVDTPWLSAFRDGLRQFGYVEGQNIKIEYRYWGAKMAVLPAIAAELVGLNCDVIVTAGSEAIQAAKSATQTVPIVMAFSGGDPVRNGIIADLAHPGGNITGLASINAELAGKRLELLKEIVPKLSRVVWFSASTAVGSTAPTRPTPFLQETQAAARSLKLELQSLEAKNAEDIPRAFQAAVKNRAGGVLIAAGGFFAFHGKTIVALLEKHRLPAVFPSVSYAETGALMIYAEDRMAHFRRAAWYVDRILKGAKPGDLPAELPRKFEFIINLKSAQKIGLTIPQSVLFRADRVIK